MSTTTIFSKGKSIKFERAAIHEMEIAGGGVVPVPVVDMRINNDLVCVHFDSSDELIEFCTKHGIEYQDQRENKEVGEIAA